MCKLTYWRFREGIIREFGIPSTASIEEKDAVIEMIERDWFFCGGCDIRTRNQSLNRHWGDGSTSIPPEVLETWAGLWRHYFPSREMPEPVDECVCKQANLRYNCFITDGDRIIVIGRICMLQFLPVQAKGMMSRRCERCYKPHRNRKDNFCKECRILIQEEKEAEENQQRLKKRIEEQQLRNYEERLRREEEFKAQMEMAELAHKREEQRLKRLKEEDELREEAKKRCDCGKMKKPQFPMCWGCRVKHIASFTPLQRLKYMCPCGKMKKPEYPICWGCKTSVKTSA